MNSTELVDESHRREDKRVVSLPSRRDVLPANV